jgi:hypothetical protein
MTDRLHRFNTQALRTIANGIHDDARILARLEA